MHFAVTVEDARAMLGLNARAFAKILEELGETTHETPSGKRTLTTVEPSTMRAVRGVRGENLGLFNGKKIVAFQGCKGGIGKTTLAYNVAVRAAQYGNRVLCIDTDQQAHLTMCLLGKEAGKHCWLDIFEERVPLAETIVPVGEHLDLVPSNLRMAIAEKRLGNTIHPKRIVAQYLTAIRDNYDIVLFDCAPALSSINHAVAFASDIVIIPQTTSRLSLDGLELSLDFLRELREDFGMAPEVRIVCNMFSQQETPSLRTLYSLMEQHQGALFQTAVRRCVKYPEAVDYERPLFLLGYRPSIAVEDLDALTRELLGLGGLRHGKNR